MFKNSKNSKGFSLVEILVATGMLGVLSIGLMTYFKNQNQTMAYSRLTSAQDNLRNLLARYALDPNLIKKSAKYYRDSTSDAGNIALDYCINGAPPAADSGCPASIYPNCCKQTPSGQHQPFHLIDPTVANHISAATSTKFSGTDLAASPLLETTFSPAHFNGDGAPCSPMSPNCAIEVVTAYDAYCPGGTPQCQKAQSIITYYTIRQATGLSKNAAGGQLKTLMGNAPTVGGIATASGGSGPTFAGHVDTNGNIGGVKGGNQKCETNFPGSHWANYDEIIKLGSQYDWSKDVWIREGFIEASNNGTSISGHLANGIFMNLVGGVNCMNWTAGAGNGPMLVATVGTMSFSSCVNLLAIACVK